MLGRTAADYKRMAAIGRPLTTDRSVRRFRRLLQSDYFSATFEAPLSEPFIFSVYVRGEARLWIDGQEVEFARSDRSERFDSQPMPLEAGRRYDIRLEFVSTLTAPKVSLNWESPSQDRQRIPTPYLYP